MSEEKGQSEGIRRRWEQRLRLSFVEFAWKTGTIDMRQISSESKTFVRVSRIGPSVLALPVSAVSRWVRGLHSGARLRLVHQDRFRITWEVCDAQ